MRATQWLIDDFVDQPKVINGASDFMVAVLGDAGRHARAAVSAPSLPLGVAVEIDAMLETDRPFDTDWYETALRALPELPPEKQ